MIHDKARGFKRGGQTLCDRPIILDK
ncbi:protein of unknown function [Hyphomicrobium sp. 1Nfss2.1]